MFKAKNSRSNFYITPSQLQNNSLLTQCDNNNHPNCKIIRLKLDKFEGGKLSRRLTKDYFENAMKDPKEKAEIINLFMKACDEFDKKEGTKFHEAFNKLFKSMGELKSLP